MTRVKIHIMSLILMSIKKLRLHKYIANCGYTSRRRAELLIQAGRVQVNGKLVTTLGSLVHPLKDQVVINGDQVKPPERYTIMLHKPALIITSTHDTHDRLTVMDILPKRFREMGVFPVGRLDRDTEGVLILTNDGDLHHHISHPRHTIDKEYRVTVKGFPSKEACKNFERGMMIDGKKTAPAQILSMVQKQDIGVGTVVIREGRKRQIRRMFDALGHPVIHLTRTRIGDLAIGKLPLGEWRVLKAPEIAMLLKKSQIKSPEKKKISTKARNRRPSGPKTTGRSRAQKKKIKR